MFIVIIFLQKLLLPKLKDSFDIHADQVDSVARSLLPKSRSKKAPTKKDRTKNNGKAKAKSGKSKQPPTRRRKRNSGKSSDEDDSDSSILVDDTSSDEDSSSTDIDQPSVTVQRKRIRR